MLYSMRASMRIVYFFLLEREKKKLHGFKVSSMYFLAVETVKVLDATLFKKKTHQLHTHYRCKRKNLTHTHTVN
jgi:hypothetical protein